MRNDRIRKGGSDMIGQYDRKAPPHFAFYAFNAFEAGKELRCLKGFLCQVPCVVTKISLLNSRLTSSRSAYD